MGVKTQFSIKDLESLSGIKAHTIRIWEKRYNLLEPSRTDTNIRFYDIDNLMRLLNVTYLYNHGYKISKISSLERELIPGIIKEIEKKTGTDNFAITEFKGAMFNFDQHQFQKIYTTLSNKKSFTEIFESVFLPLLHDIGILWQTGAIDPAHEHFIAELIKQKVILSTEQAYKNKKTNNDKLFILFLPLHEIHEIGLLYVNYKILINGYRTVYLGNNIPIESLEFVLPLHKRLIFISYFTVQPEKDQITTYLQNFYDRICKSANHKFWILGSQAQGEGLSTLPKGFQIFKSLSALEAKL